MRTLIQSLLSLIVTITGWGVHLKYEYPAVEKWFLGAGGAEGQAQESASVNLAQHSPLGFRVKGLGLRV